MLAILLSLKQYAYLCILARSENISARVLTILKMTVAEDDDVARDHNEASSHMHTREQRLESQQPPPPYFSKTVHVAIEWENPRNTL